MSRAAFFVSILALVACVAPEMDPDVTNDGVVDVLDASLVSSCLEQDPAVNLQCAGADVDGDGDVDRDDLDRVVEHFGETGFPVADTTAPSVEIATPGNLALVNVAEIELTGSVDDPGVTVLVNGQVAEQTGGGFRTNLVLHEGVNLLTATATDAAGNVGSASISVVLDSRAPQVTIDAPIDGEVTTSASIAVSGMINDIVVGTVNGGEASVFVNGVAAIVANRSFLATAVPLAPGVNTIEAIGTDLAGNSARASILIEFSPVVGEPEIRILSGSGQSAPVATALTQPLVVELLDATGAPVAGEGVIFRVRENDGILSDGVRSARAVRVLTDGSGHAQAEWRLGTRSGAGNNRVSAAAMGFVGMADFVASGLAGVPIGIVADGGSMQTGSVAEDLPRPFGALVFDEGGNRLSGVEVTFRVATGGGNFAGSESQTVATDANGLAEAVLTLGPAEGQDNNVVFAEFEANPGAPAVFAASALAAGPPEDTAVVGVVLDNAEIPVPGVTVSIDHTSLSTQTDAEGQFVLPGAPVGSLHLLVDGSTAARPGLWPALGFDLVAVAGRQNTVGMPIYMLPIETENVLCVDELAGGILTLPEVPGFALEVAAGTATFAGGLQAGCVSVTTVVPDRVPMPPSIGAQPRLVVTIQPAGTAFDPPAPLTIPNTDGRAAGAVSDLFSFDHDLGQFVSIGTGTVSEDGSVIRSDPGVGILKAGWHGDFITRIAGQVASCDDGNPCTEDFYSFEPDSLGCASVANSAMDGEACIPETRLFAVVGQAVFEGEEDAILDSTGGVPEFDPDLVDGPDPCGAFAPMVVNFSIAKNCAGTCSQGTCQGTKVSYDKVRTAVCTGINAVYSNCVGEPLRQKMQFNLVTQGWKVSCKDRSGACDRGAGGYSFAGSNQMVLCPDASLSAEEIVFHEMVHGLGCDDGKPPHSEDRTFDDIDFSKDRPYGCTKACLPIPSIQPRVLLRASADACQ